MRLRAYLDALAEAAKIPEQLSTYGGELSTFDPRSLVMHRIKDIARKDEALFHVELIDILTWEPENAASGKEATSESNQSGHQEGRTQVNQEES